MVEKNDLSQELKDYFINNPKTLKYIKSQSEIEKILNNWISISPLWINKENWTKVIPLEEVVLGLSVNLFGLIIGKNKSIIFNSKKSKTLSFNDFNKVEFDENGRWSSKIKFDGNVLINLSEKSGSDVSNIKTLFNKTYDIVILKLEEQKRLKEEIKKLISFLLERKIVEKENQRLNDLKKSQTDILSELDKDGNGVIDIIEGGDDFMKLFRKHQSIIKEFDKEYINHLVKISNYLKVKRNNVQEIFLKIKKTKTQSQLKENVGLLKNQIHTYEVILFHSINIIISIVEDDLITVNEIYEEFDKLKIFKTDHENEISQKLSNIGDGLSNLMYSINSMERNIVGGLNQLSYVTQDGFYELNNSVTRELESIDSSIKFNNLLTGIQTYQTYKINQNTKSLRG